MRAATLFSGGGLADCGIKAAGFDLAWAVEHDAAIAAVYRANHGDHVLTADVCAVDYAALPRVDWLHASPVCTRYSVANAGRGETDLDLATAAATARAIEAQTPDYVTVENVAQYQDSDAYRLIVRTLDRLGYVWHAATVNSADHGVPQTRRRLIVRASRLLLRPLPAPTPWRGWYDAIADILDTLPPSQFAPWQMARLPEDVRESVLFNNNAGTDDYTTLNRRWAGEPSSTVVSTPKSLTSYRAFIIDGQESGEAGAPDRPAVLRRDDEPMYTLTGGTGTRRPARAWLTQLQAGARGDWRRDDEPAKTISASDANAQRLAWLATGRVVAMTPHALARFQSVPDWYALPERKALACKVIGNGVPPLLMQTIGGAW